MVASSRIKHLATKVKSFQTGLFNIILRSLYSNALHSRPYPIKNLWDVGYDKFAASVGGQYGPKSQEKNLVKSIPF